MNHFIRTFLSLLLTSASLVANAYSADYYTSSSKLSSGKWVKIKVTQTGMQQITNDQLRQWGFDNPDDVSVFGYGGNMLTNEFKDNYADDLPAQPVYRTDDKIIFYGESDVRIFGADPITSVKIQRNSCATAGYYFITDTYPGASAAPAMKGSPATSASALAYHCSHQFIEKEESNPAKAGVRYFGTNFKNEPQQTFTFEAPSPYNPGSSNYRARLMFRWGSDMDESQKLDYTADFTVSGSQNSVLYTPSYYEYYDFTEGYLSVLTRSDGNNTYNITVNEPSSNYAFAAMDYVSFSYYRRNYLAGISQLSMAFTAPNSGANVKFSYPDPNVQYWNVCNPAAPFAYNSVFNQSNRTATIAFESKYVYSSTGHAYVVAFNPAKDMYPVEYAGEITNQDLHNLATPQMLIITSSQYLQYAEALAQAHRDKQGLDVLVVDQNDIYNEFSSGTPSVMGYRRFIKMFYDRDPERIKYVLLYGGGTYDNRHLLYGDDSYLLTYQCETDAYINLSTRAFSADSFFGMLDDNFTISSMPNAQMQVAVGRIPVTSVADAIDINKKLIGYLTNPPLDSSRNRAVLSADAGDTSDPNTHERQVEEIASLITSLSPKTTVTKAYCDLYPWQNSVCQDTRKVLVRALNNGQALFGYSGHGNSSAISGSGLYSKTDIYNNSYATSPFVFLSTCDAMSFDRNGSGFGEEFLLSSHSGAIGILAACRTVYQDHNQRLYLAFINKFYTSKSGETIGDVYREARNSLTATCSTDAGINTLNYNFMGDPAIPMYVPAYNVATTAISSTEIADADTQVSVYPLANNTIEGDIVDADGVIASDFNGQIYISVYDTPSAVKTLGQVTNNNPYDVTLDEKCLNQIITKVVNGHFSTDISIPQATTPGGVARISYYAVTDGKEAQAAGCFNNLVIAQYDESQAIADSDAPVISQMYLDSPDFVDGAEVNSSTNLHVVIDHDASGLCITDTKLENNMRLILDGNQSYSSIAGAVNIAEDGSYTIDFAIDNLSDGHHSLTLVVYDNAGNRSSRTIYFTVINRDAQVSLFIDEQPARTEANFSLDHNFTSEPTGRLVIEDNAGNTIYSKADVTFPFAWDLSLADGTKIPDGTYNCYVILNGNKQYGSSDFTKLIVVKQ